MASVGAAEDEQRPPGTQPDRDLGWGVVPSPALAGLQQMAIGGGILGPASDRHELARAVLCAPGRREPRGGGK